MPTAKSRHNRNPKGRTPKNTPEQVTEALLKADGNLTAAAAKLGVGKGKKRKRQMK